MGEVAVVGAAVVSTLVKLFLRAIADHDQHVNNQRQQHARAFFNIEGE